MPANYPCVPGREIVGRVTKVGPKVTKMKPGDLAGVGLERALAARGAAATDLFTRLDQHGFSAAQLQAFLPKVLEVFKDKLPPEALEKVEGLVPGLSEVAESSDA